MSQEEEATHRFSSAHGKSHLRWSTIFTTNLPQRSKCLPTRILILMVNSNTFSSLLNCVLLHDSYPLHSCLSLILACQTVLPPFIYNSERKAQQCNLVKPLRSNSKNQTCHCSSSTGKKNYSTLCLAQLKVTRFNFNGFGDWTRKQIKVFRLYRKNVLSIW